MQLPSTSQTNPQGLAAISMGNPAPLQKRVAQSPKDPQTGFPQDLAAALALSIVNTEQDAAKRQAAMQQLQQAMGPAGQMPTVVQGLQQAAAQKLRQMPQQQGQPEQMAQAPQSAGIDQAPVEFGMAGGGIVSFNGEDGSKVKSDISKEELEEEEQKKRDAKLLGENWEEAKASFKDIASLPLRGVAGAAESVITRPLRAMGINMPYLPSSVYGGDRTSMTPMYDKVLRERAAAEQKQKAGLSQAGAGRGRVNPPVVDPDAPRPAVIRHLGDYQPSAQDMALIEEDIRKTGNTSPTTRFMYPDRPRPAPAEQAPSLATTPQAAPAAPAAPALTPEQADLNRDYYSYLKKTLGANADTSAEEMMRRYKGIVGEPDTAAYDEQLANLKRRRAQLERPKEGLAGLVDYFKQIAAAGPQRDWMSAGAKGALGVDAANEAALEKQYLLDKESADVLGKKLAEQRTFKKEMFTVSEERRKEIEKQVQEAAKTYGLDKNKQDELRNRLLVQEMSDRAAMQRTVAELAGRKDVARIGAASHDSLDRQLAEARARGDTKEVANILEAMKKKAEALGEGKQTKLAEIAKFNTAYKDELAVVRAMLMKPNPDEKTKKMLNDKLAALSAAAAAVNLTLGDVGLGAAPASVGSAPPPGAVRLKQ